MRFGWRLGWAQGTTHYKGEILQRNGAILIQYLCSDLDPVPDVTAVRLDQLRHVLSPKRMIVKQRKSRRQTVAIAIRTNQRIYRLCYQLLKISSTIYWWDLFSRCLNYVRVKTFLSESGTLSNKWSKNFDERPHYPTSQNCLPLPRKWGILRGGTPRGTKLHLIHPSPHPKRCLDWFIRFSRAHGHVQQTDSQYSQ